KNLEEKYKKADELVGKMILILLADLGIRVSHEQESFAKNPPRYQPPVLARASPSPVPSRDPVKWTAVENPLKNFSGQNPDYLLKQARISDFGDSLARSTVLQSIDPSLNGCYEGQVSLTDGSNRIWQVRMDIAFQAGDGSISGHSLVEISENGKV